MHLHKIFDLIKKNNRKSQDANQFGLLFVWFSRNKIYFQIQTRLQLHLPYENKNYLNDANIQH